MDELKQSVQLAVHEQKDPLLIYKFEAFELFKAMPLLALLVKYLPPAISYEMVLIRKFKLACHPKRGLSNCVSLLYVNTNIFQAVYF